MNFKKRCLWKRYGNFSARVTSLKNVRRTFVVLLFDLSDNIFDVKKNDRVVWIDPEGKEEFGTVKWVGFLDPHGRRELVAGVEFVS